MKKTIITIICLILTVCLNTGNVLATSSHRPFYGVWVSAARSKRQASDHLKKVNKHGFHSADIYISTQWSNLNKKTYYLISTGEYQSKYKAAKALKKAKKVYKDAYIRYTGKYKANSIKVSRLSDGWYTGYGDGPYVEHSMDYGLITSMRLKKSGNNYYVIITGRLNKYYINAKHPDYLDEENDFADQLSSAKRMIPLSDKCEFIELEDRNYYISRKQFFNQRLPGIDNKILIKNHQIIKMIVSA